jgi:RNA polymerase sigma-70 factor, ECF subfamily
VLASATVNVAAFIAGLGTADLGPVDVMTAALARAQQVAAQRWPAFAVPDEVFLQHLGRCLAGEGPDFVAALEKLEVADVYFCCACLQGIPAALTQLEQTHLASISAFIGHFDRSPAFVDDVASAVREKLLVNQGGNQAGPRLAHYLGQGPLHSWIAVVSQRTALDQLRQQKRIVPMDDSALESHLSNSSDPDMALVKARLRGQFEDALRAALARLTVRERTAFRLTLIAGFPLEKVGAMYQVNASTVSRWLAKARETLLAEMQRFLRERQDLDPADLESMVRLVGSQVDISLSRLLGDSLQG